MPHTRWWMWSPAAGQVVERADARADQVCDGADDAERDQEEPDRREEQSLTALVLEMERYRAP